MMDICATYTSRCLWILRFSPSTSVRQVDSEGKELSKSDRLTEKTRLDALVNKLRNPPDVVVRGDVRLFVTYMFYDWYLDEVSRRRPHCLMGINKLDSIVESI